MAKPPTDLSTVPRGAIATSGKVDATLLADAENLLRGDKAVSTRRCYRSSWTAFSSWCEEQGLATLPAPPSTLVLYMAALKKKGRRLSTVTFALAAISHAHTLANVENSRKHPLVTEALKNLGKAIGSRPERKRAVRVEMLRRMMSAAPPTLLGLRNRALLLVTFASAMRRDNVVKLRIEDVTFDEDGMRILLRKSKTDQAQRGFMIHVPFTDHELTCPVKTLKLWLAESGITEGFVFRSMTKKPEVKNKPLSGNDVATIVKAAIVSIGIDPKEFAAHSLRSGLVTSARRAGKDMRDIMAQTGHKSIEMVERYFRDEEGSLGEHNPVKGIGL